ncbi:MAG: hypothetical protein MKZ85_00795 [Pedosphaera sp.]|nr:hypothetical protein [Pedosphaera sp.]
MTENRRFWPTNQGGRFDRSLPRLRADELGSALVNPVTGGDVESLRIFSAKSGVRHALGQARLG